MILSEHQVKSAVRLQTISQYGPGHKSVKRNNKLLAEVLLQGRRDVPANDWFRLVDDLTSQAAGYLKKVAE